MARPPPSRPSARPRWARGSETGAGRKSGRRALHADKAHRGAWSGWARSAGCPHVPRALAKVYEPGVRSPVAIAIDADWPAASTAAADPPGVRFPDTAPPPARPSPRQCDLPASRRSRAPPVPSLSRSRARPGSTGRGMRGRGAARCSGTRRFRMTGGEWRAGLRARSGTRTPRANSAVCRCRARPDRRGRTASGPSLALSRASSNQAAMRSPSSGAAPSLGGSTSPGSGSPTSGDPASASAGASRSASHCARWAAATLLTPPRVV